MKTSPIIYEKQSIRWIRRMGAYELHGLTTEQCGPPPTNITVAFSLDGKYIGDARTARTLVKKYGIERFCLRTRTSSVCSIGFSPARGKWFGWSHRAISGFGVGTELKRGHLGSPANMKVGVARTIRTLAQAKAAASRFAEAVS